MSLQNIENRMRKSPDESCASIIQHFESDPPVMHWLFPKGKKTAGPSLLDWLLLIIKEASRQIEDCQARRYQTQIHV